MYGIDGQQGCANILFDGKTPGASLDVPRLPKMNAIEQNDPGTFAPSRNFIYDFEAYRFFVRDEWTPILAHDDHGRVTSGSWDNFHAAHRQGREFKVGVTGLWDDPLQMEMFTLLGSGWVHTARQWYEVLTHPLVRLAPTIPLKYRSGQWDVSWAFLRTDGLARVRSFDPAARVFRDWETRVACRWFVR